jgi:hypothetical protein
MDANDKKVRKVGRPRKDQTRAEASGYRPTRSSVGGYRDKLPVKGMDPAFHYRWFLGDSVDSYRIMSALDRGYSFAPAEGHAIGELHVYKVEDGSSSVVRIPAGRDGGHLYLMRIPIELHQRGMEEKSQRILETEKITSNRFGQEEGGVYGSIKIDNSVGLDRGH